MSESPNAAGLTAAEAARMLLWLREMGADEAHADQPVMRYAEQPPQSAPAPVAERPAPRPNNTSAAPTASTAAALRPTAEGEASIEEIHAAARSAMSLADLVAALERFDAHPLRRTASKLCFAEEAPGARILVIADRPRAEEDRAGRIFADKNAALLERMLAAIGIGEGTAQPVSYLSFLPWRPPGARPPIEIECRLILPFAERAIALLKPHLILAFGGLAGQWLAGGPESIQRQRGTWLAAGDIPLLSTFHPEALLKSPALKKLAWQDLLSFRARLESLT
jgi:uracil-DNA glycosylase